MAKHKLDGGVEIEVTGVTPVFGNIPPRIEGTGRERLLTFGKPTEGAPLAGIKFRFKATGNTAGFLFGIKQICTLQEYQGLYAGLKETDGSISIETRGFAGTRMLDISPSVLRILFDARDCATGAVATAPHAPFFSDTPVSVRPGASIELEVTDHPGGNFRMELQNGATDRPNFLDRVTMSEDFVTALVAVKLDGASRPEAHIPLEGIRWQVKSSCRVEWNGNTPTLQRPIHTARKVEDLSAISSAGEFDILRNMSLVAADSIVQKFNDGLFAAQGQYKQQDFNKPTQRLTTLGSRGVVYIQFPIVAN